MAYVPLTKSEEKLMLFLWEHDEPMSVTEMLEMRDDEKHWTKNYTRDIVRALEEKGAVECCGLQRSTKNYARRFRPVMGRDEYFTHLAKDNGVSVSRMLRVEALAMARTGQTEKMDELIRELEDIIEEYRTKGDDT